MLRREGEDLVFRLALWDGLDGDVSFRIDRSALRRGAKRERGRSESVTYAHQTVLRHPARVLALVALRGAAAHVEEAEGWLAAVAVRFEDGV